MVFHDALHWFYEEIGQRDAMAEFLFDFDEELKIVGIEVYVVSLNQGKVYIVSLNQGEATKSQNFHIDYLKHFCDDFWTSIVKIV